MAKVKRTRQAKLYIEKASKKLEMWNIISITVTHLTLIKCYTFIFFIFQLLYMEQRTIKMSYSNDRLIHYKGSVTGRAFVE
jgi:hypothetical protein